MYLEKIIVFLICFIFHITHATIDISCILVILITLLLSCFSSLLQRTQKNTKNPNLEYSNIYKLEQNVLKVSFICYFLVAPAFSQTVYYMPLLFIDITNNRLMISAVLGIINILLSLYDYQNLQTTLVIFLLSCICCMLAYRYKATNKLTSKLYELQDSSNETKLLIQAKNKAILETQDNKIMMATLQERNRIAREIHDNVGHTLTRSILQIGAIKAINKDAVLTPALNDLHETLNSAMTNIRSSVHDLHDESVNLKTAIEDIISSTDTINIKLDYDLSDYMPRNIKYCFIAIIKEAINNCLKHSDADSIKITAREHPGFYQLLIYDNGTTMPKDFDSDTVDGIGLANMTERVNNLGGNIRFSVDNGFRILITIIKKTD